MNFPKCPMHDIPGAFDNEFKTRYDHKHNASKIHKWLSGKCSQPCPCDQELYRVMQVAVECVKMLKVMGHRVAATAVSDMFGLE